MTNPNKKVRDSIFTKMFGDPSKKYLLELYRALHPEDTDVTTDDLTIVSIDNVIVNDIYNDLGLMVRNKLLILAEAQVTWSKNVILRALFYLSKTYSDYIYSNSILKRQLYTNSKMDLPQPELYILYAGKKGNKPDILSLKEEIFKDAKMNIDLEAQVIYADDKRHDIIQQYLAFCVILKEQKTICDGDLKEAIRKTIEICMKEGNLAEYLSSHKREMEEYTMFFLSQEEIDEMRLEDAREEGHSAGLLEGHSAGMESVILSALSKGRNPMEISEFTGISLDKVLEVSRKQETY